MSSFFSNQKYLLIIVAIVVIIAAYFLLSNRPLPARAVFYIVGGLTWFISIPNLFLDLFLSSLVFLNIATAMYSYFVFPLRPGLKGLIGLVPSLFTGFVCCVPTFIITLGAISTSITVFS